MWPARVDKTRGKLAYWRKRPPAPLLVLRVSNILETSQLSFEQFFDNFLGQERLPILKLQN